MDMVAHHKRRNQRRAHSAQLRILLCSFKNRAVRLYHTVCQQGGIIARADALRLLAGKPKLAKKSLNLTAKRVSCQHAGDVSAVCAAHPVADQPQVYAGTNGLRRERVPVSYTHLTLPTILLV